MDPQASTTECDLEGMLFGESMEAKALPLPLSFLERITDNFSSNNQIGCGGFAVVYKGLFENRAVAVKKLLRAIEDEKFIGEVRCLMKVKHKNIVRFLGYCSDTQGQMVEHGGKFVMGEVCLRLLCFEYLPNGSLDKYIKDPSREWGTCYQIIKGVCNGLHYLHKEQIVHSDLKPANILLDNDMVPKITDFGNSRCFDREQTHTFTKNLVGSMGYVPPEFYNGQISFKSDIYSLGVIIKEILTSEKGYPVVENVLEFWRHKVEKSWEAQQLGQIRVCTEVCISCLESDPAKRPCAQGIIDVLEQTEERTGAGISSLVENGNKSTRQIAIFSDDEAFKDWSDPKTVATALEAVTQAICLNYGQDVGKPYEYDSYHRLYRGAYNLILHGKGEELYAAMETTMTCEVQNLHRTLDAASTNGAVFLQELLAKWNQHIRAVDFTRDILMYMDRTYVPTNCKTPIKELGLRLWRDHMVLCTENRDSLVEAVVELDEQGQGKDELVAGVKKMLMELGEDVERRFYVAIEVMRLSRDLFRILEEGERVSSLS